MITLSEIQATGLPLEDHGAIAAALSVGRTKLVPTNIGFGKVLDALGPVDGAAVLDTLEAAKASNRPLYWAWNLLEKGELDVSLDSTRAQIDALAGAGAMTQAQADALKALAVQPDTVSATDVMNALGV